MKSNPNGSPESTPEATISAPTQLANLQLRFAGHIRDPENIDRPTGTEDRRMAIYRDLFFNNLSGLLASNFPVLHKIVGEDAWRDMMRDFMQRHRARTPLFPELPRELLQYLQNTREPQESDPPFMLELAHYEWAELAISLDKADLEKAQREQTDGNPESDLLEGTPVLSPLAWQLSYHFPVHHIRPDFQPQKPGTQASHLLIYRRLDDEVGFMELQAVSARLYHLLKDNPELNGLSVLSLIAKELQLPDASRLVEQGRQQLEQWRQRDIILGTRP
jgi:hypothetical protein